MHGMKYRATCPACETRLPRSWVRHHARKIEICPGCKNELRRAPAWIHRGHLLIVSVQIACLVGVSFIRLALFNSFVGILTGLYIGMWFAIEVGHFLFPYVSPYVVAEAYCVRCGYSLTGNVSGICPECGKIISRAR
jgi:hypothetical protein